MYVYVYILTSLSRNVTISEAVHAMLGLLVETAVYPMVQVHTYRCVHTHTLNIHV